MKKMLICGANGFIGKNLVEHFSATYDIRAVDQLRTDCRPDAHPPNVEWMVADLRNSNDVARVIKGVDIVLHYAATTTGAADIVSKPYIHVTDNAVMTSLLLREAFEQHVEHFIMPSCTIMYQSSDVPVKESDFNEADGILPKYFGAGHTKVYLEKMCEFFAGFGRTKHTVLRQSNIYGPHDKYDLKKGHVFGATVVKVMEAENEIVVWGTGEEERDLLHVNDLVSCVEAALNKQEVGYELINVGLGESISISNLVQSMVAASGKDLQITYDETKPTIKTKLAVDTTKAKEVFGWRPQISLDSGIKKTLSWYKENKLC
tara:strand:- start:4236 stop:5189 length:954 start_codon:yes stop_codon:yes gene_type:complete